MKKVRRVFLSPLWLLLSVPGYLGWRLLPALADGPLGTAVGIMLLLAVVVFIPLSIRIRHVRRQKLADALAWLGYTAMGFFSTLFVLTLLRDAALLCVRWLVSTARFAALTSASAHGVMVLALASTAVGLAVARRPRLVHVDVPIERLPDGLHGFSIAQLSDVHVGPTIKGGFVQKLVDRVNGLRADLIAVTGDLVDGSVPDLAEHVAPLAELRSREGSFFVTGNHEYYSGVMPWLKYLPTLGVRILMNEHVILLHHHAPLVLAGVADFSAHNYEPSHRSDAAMAIAGAPRAAIKVLLAHQPRSAPAAEAAGFDLQLSGHTHGGQFLPWNFFVRFQQPFTAGLDRVKEMLVYTSRGTGYWGPPKRFGAPSEITLLRLVSA